MHKGIKIVVSVQLALFAVPKITNRKGRKKRKVFWILFRIYVKVKDIMH